MDPDSWCTRPSASRRYHSPSDLFHGGEDVDEEHAVEAKNGVCPVCAKQVGMDLVGHITIQHGSLLKVQRKRRFRKIRSNLTLSILRKELHEGNLQSLLGGSQHLVSSSNTKPDPLLSSFMCNLPVVEPGARKHTSPFYRGSRIDEGKLK